MSAVTTATLRNARARIAGLHVTEASRRRFAIEYLDLVTKAPTLIHLWALVLDFLDPAWSAGRRRVVRRTLDDLALWQLTDAGRRALDHHRTTDPTTNGAT